MDRRSILRSIGTGIGASAMVGVGAATPGDSEVGAVSGPEIATEALSNGDTRRQLAQVRSSLAGEAMETFLSDEYSRRRNPIVMREVAGTRISGPEFPNHVRLKAPLRFGQADEQYVEFRVLENHAVAAEAVVGGEVYKTAPELSRPGRDRTDLDTDSEQAVMDALEWYQTVQSSGVRTADATNCDSSWTFENNSAACQLLSGLTVIAGAVLAVVPEPGTTAVGTVSIAGVLSGSCTVIDAVDQMIDDCNVNEITICAYQPNDQGNF